MDKKQPFSLCAKYRIYNKLSSGRFLWGAIVVFLRVLNLGLKFENATKKCLEKFEKYSNGLKIYGDVGQGK